MLFLSFCFLVTSHGLKSFISCSTSWQIIQQKDRYYSKVLTLLFPAPMSSEGERMKTSWFKKCWSQRWPCELLICMMQQYRRSYSAKLKAWQVPLKNKYAFKLFLGKGRVPECVCGCNRSDWFPAVSLQCKLAWAVLSNCVWCIGWWLSRLQKYIEIHMEKMYSKKIML